MRDAIADPQQSYSSRPAPAKRGKARKGKTPLKWLRHAVAQRPGTAVILGLAAVAAVGVPLNALYLQEGRHPAPLFQVSAATPEPASPAEPAAPIPPARPASFAHPQKGQTAKLEAAKSEVAKTESPRAAKEARDPIGQLLEGGGAAKAEEKPADKNVLYAQRALVKLGYVLRADGLFGGTTRQAIEKFERDIGLPVKGELSPKILKQLVARSGLPNAR